MVVSDIDILSVLSAFNRECYDIRSEALDAIRRSRVIGDLNFVARLREIILDFSMTWTEKAHKWTADSDREEHENEELFRDIWNIISEGQPWPLDEVPAKK